MRKSKINKMKLASVLLMTTVLIPNIAYADEEIDENVETLDIEEQRQTINEQETESEETAETSETAEEEAAVQDVTPEPDVNTYNSDIETESGTTSENVQEESTGGGGGGEILQPAEPDEQPEEEPVEDNTDAAEEDRSEESQGEEETPGDTSEEAESEYDNEWDTEETEPELSETDEVYENYDDNSEPEQPSQEAAESQEQPSQEESSITSQPSEAIAEPAEEAVTDSIETEPETVEEGAATAGTGQKKLYRYDYGDILNGISFSEESLADDLSTLDQRVTRVMSSKIIEEKDLTEAQKLELEEQVKSEEANSYDGEELPNTGEADSTNYAAAGLLTIIGAILLFMSKKLKTDN